MNNQLQVFTYGTQNVRTVVIDGEVWLVAKDVCDILGIQNVTQAVQELDDDERSMYYIGRSPINGGGGEVNVINEPGLYKLTFRSRKPYAKKFTRWVTHEVLPSIQATGSYIAPNAKANLPKHSGIIKAVERITHKAFKCKEEKDFQEVLALNAAFEKTFGVSALDLAGLRIVKHDEREDYEQWARSCCTRPEDREEFDRQWGYIRAMGRVYFTLEHDYPKLKR